MKINSLDNSGYILSVNRVKMAKKTKSDQDPADKVHISDRARQLASGEGLSPERLKLIRQRMGDNFYEQDEVLKEVAHRILQSKDLNSKSDQSGEGTKA